MNKDVPVSLLVDSGSVRQRIHAENERSAIRLVVLDDDPTGCQTVHDVPVLLDWAASTLAPVVASDSCFYILHNSRSVSAAVARQLNRDIVRQVRTQLPAGSWRLISRSDSTLRGHFWPEVETLQAEAGPFDGVLVVPYFGEGGRVTMDDTHYLQTAEGLVPVDQTEFARDPVFGFTTAHLPDWIAGQSAGRWTAADVVSISLNDIRLGGVEAVAQKLLNVNSFQPVVVNATSDADLEIVVLGLQQAEQRGKRFLYRTAASFVKIRAGMADQPFYQPVPGERGAGLIIVGSHVPKTTRQVEALRERLRLPEIELNIDRMLADNQGHYGREVGEQLRAHLASGQTPLLVTQRNYGLTGDADERLRAGQTISAFLADVVASLTVRPRFVVAKGGITSHDVAARGLRMKTARVLGQLRPGVPVWRAGDDSRFPGLLYVVFPGNVGDDLDLARSVKQLLG